MTFSAGQMSANLTLSTMDDSTTELTEYFKVMIISTDQPSAVMIVSPSTAFIAIEDNDPGTVQMNEPDGTHMHVLCTGYVHIIIAH